jgi:hypothetical protein
MKKAIIFLSLFIVQMSIISAQDTLQIIDSGREIQELKNHNPENANEDGAYGSIMFDQNENDREVRLNYKEYPSNGSILLGAGAGAIAGTAFAEYYYYRQDYHSTYRAKITSKHLVSALIGAALGAGIVFLTLTE